MKVLGVYELTSGQAWHNRKENVESEEKKNTLLQSMPVNITNPKSLLKERLS